MLPSESSPNAVASPLPSPKAGDPLASRRAEVVRGIVAETGLDDATLERLVRAFYAATQRDPDLAPIFTAHVRDWEAHIRRMCVFWGAVALLTGRYHGHPMDAHLPLALEPHHFARWMALFEATAHEICTPKGADYMIDRARRIADSLQRGLVLHAQGFGTAA